MSEQPGRYQRSASGMIGAMLILLLGIGAFVGFRALNRNELAIEPQQVDYLASVRFAQESDRVVVYPPSVPESWTATSVEAVSDRVWSIGFVTPEGFAGVQQSDAPVEDLLATYVDEDTTPLEPVEIEGSEWDVVEDASGDLGYVGDVDGIPVLVYGSVPAADLEELAGSLTTDPL